MDEKIVLGRFPDAWVLIGRARWVQTTLHLGLWCEFWNHDGDWSQVVEFVQAEATRWHSEPLSTLWHSEGSYNVLVEVVDSSWIRELLEGASPGAWQLPLRHFLVYIEDYGAYEVAAADVIWNPVEAVSREG